MKKSRTRSVNKQKPQKKNKVKSLRKNKVKSLKKKKKHLNKKSTRRNRKRKGGMPDNSSSRENSQGNDCSICFDQIDNKNEIETTECEHRFHKKCLYTWCRTRKTCPICRTEIPLTCEKLKQELDKYNTDDYWIKMENYPEEVRDHLYKALITIFGGTNKNSPLNGQSSYYKPKIINIVEDMTDLTEDQKNIIKKALLHEFMMRVD